MTTKLNWEARNTRRRMALELAQRRAPMPEDQERLALQLRQHHRRGGGNNGVTARGAQGHDAYARRNYAGSITLPKLKFMEGDND